MNVPSQEADGAHVQIPIFLFDSNCLLKPYFHTAAVRQCCLIWITEEWERNKLEKYSRKQPVTYEMLCFELCPLTVPSLYLPANYSLRFDRIFYLFWGNEQDWISAEWETLVHARQSLDKQMQRFRKNNNKNLFHADRCAYTRQRRRQEELKCDIRIFVYQTEEKNMKKVQKNRKVT